MKKTICLCIGLVFLLGLSESAVAVSYEDELIVINDMATYLVDNQNDDGGWDWTQPEDGSGDPDPSSGSTSNTAGATARGLVAAYHRTGNIAYLNAAVKTGKFIVDNQTTEVGAHKDVLFLKELDTACLVAGIDNIYGGKTFLKHGKDSAANAVVIFESGTYTSYSSGATYTWDASGDFGSDIINAYEQFRGSGEAPTAGLLPWEVGEWAQALYEIDTTAYALTALDASDDLFGLVIGADGLFGTDDDGYTGPDNYEDWWWGLGLSGLLEGMATTGSDQGNIDLVVAQLSGMGTYGDFQNAGYYALAMQLAGEHDLAVAAGIDIYNAYISQGLSNGYSSIYLESLGEGLHGLSHNPVPEPGTLFLLGSGLLGMAGMRKKKFKKSV